MAASGTLCNMERCFMNRVCAKSWTEPRTIYFAVDTNVHLNERTCSGKSSDKSSLYWSAKALADVYSSPLDFNKSLHCIVGQKLQHSPFSENSLSWWPPAYFQAAREQLKYAMWILCGPLAMYVYVNFMSTESTDKVYFKYKIPK